MGSLYNSGGIIGVIAFFLVLAAIRVFLESDYVKGYTRRTSMIKFIKTVSIIAVCVVIIGYLVSERSDTVSLTLRGASVEVTIKEISAMAEGDGGTMIILKSGQKVFVSESIKQIKDKL